MGVLQQASLLWLEDISFSLCFQIGSSSRLLPWSLGLCPFLNLFYVKPPLVADLWNRDFPLLRPFINEILANLKVCSYFFYLHPSIFQRQSSKISRNSEEFESDRSESCIKCQMFCQWSVVVRVVEKPGRREGLLEEGCHGGRRLSPHPLLSCQQAYDQSNSYSIFLVLSNSYLLI